MFEVIGFWQAVGPYTTLNTTCDIYDDLNELAVLHQRKQQRDNRVAPAMAVTHSVFRGEYSPRLVFTIDGVERKWSEYPLPLSWP